MPVLPKHDLSHWVGRLVHHQLPEPLARKSVRMFAKAYQINLDEAEHPIEHYRTIGELFTRRLKPGVRPIPGALVHPCDAVITTAGSLQGLSALQAKGKNYSVTELLRSSHWASHFEGGSFATYYLCPTDYHRVHFPIDGEVIWSCQVPGELWPVNDWSVQNVLNLFTVNERVVTLMDSKVGKVAIVMVAATNVGNITVSYDEHIRTNMYGHERKVREKSYQPGVSFRCGEELGIFHMGSTVILLFERSSQVGDLSAWQGEAVKMGASLLRSSGTA